MPRRIPLIAIAALLLFAAAFAVPYCQRRHETPPSASSSASSPSIKVFFSPKGGCTETVVRELEKAKDTVFVQAYSFTSSPIAEALLKAFRRGAKRMPDVDVWQIFHVATGRTVRTLFSRSSADLCREWNIAFCTDPNRVQI